MPDAHETHDHAQAAQALDRWISWRKKRVSLLPIGSRDTLPDKTACIPIKNLYPIASSRNKNK